MEGVDGVKYKEKVDYSGNRNDIISINCVKHYPTHQGAELARRYGGAPPRVGPKRLQTIFSQATMNPRQQSRVCEGSRRGFTVDGDGNLPEKECICGNVIKCRPLFVLDGVFEGADSLAFRNLDREDATGIIVEHEASLYLHYNVP